jgi:DNA polymerase-3 subunit beta
MNLSITKEQMLLGLQAVQNIVGTRTTLPVLSNALLRAEGNHLELTTTDLDVSVSSTVEATVKRPGATSLPVRRLFSIAREVASPMLDIEVDDRHVCSLQAGPSFFRIRGLAPEEFPPLASFKDERKVVLPQEKMRQMVCRTAFAMSTEESRYVLNGVFMTFEAHKVTMVATDGRRLALCEQEMDVPAKSQGQLIVPAKAVAELERLLQDKGEVEIHYGESRASFALRDDKGQNIVIVTKLVEGSYPNYRQVIPTQTKERVTLPREEFLHALLRAKIMTSEKQNSVKLQFTKNTLAISANTPDVGEARETLAINYKGADLAIAFNPDYLLDPLKALTEEEIVFELTDELSPGVIKINGPFVYVVMPMRLSQS